MAVHPDGRLFVDHARRGAVLDTVTRKYRSDFNKTLKVEEMAHRAHDLVQPYNRIINGRIFRRLPESMQAGVMEGYGSSFDPEVLGSEYLRMLVQLRNGMPLSEAFHSDTNVLEHMLRQKQSPYVEDLVKRISGRLIGTDGGGEVPVGRNQKSIPPGKPKGMGSPFERGNGPEDNRGKTSPPDFMKPVAKTNPLDFIAKKPDALKLVGGQPKPGGGKPIVNWKSSLQFGHTFKEHGQHKRKNLMGEAAGRGLEQGIWNDNQKAAEFLAGLQLSNKNVVYTEIPDGLGSYIKPDGNMIPTRYAVVVPFKRKSGIRDAYPISEQKYLWKKQKSPDQ